MRQPSPIELLREQLTALELPRFLLAWPELARLPRGDGRPVLVLPGFAADNFSTLALRRYLTWLGHDARGWQRGRNGGDVPELIEGVGQEVGTLAASRGPVALVGWSLGGYLAREIARDRPDAVRRVITLGSPVVGGPKYTAVAPLYQLRGADLDAIEAEVAARTERPLQVPVTALWSRNDGVVAWEACLDPSGDTEEIEVRTTHLGMGFSAEVYRVVAERLAEGAAPERLAV